MTTWIEPPPFHGPVLLPGLHPLVAQTLVRRGITTPEAARAFLDPDAGSSVPSTDLPGLSTAMDRIMRAIRSREPICVWGDFDVDGQTSTAILVQALQALGANVTYHIPVRAKESHGVNVPFLAGLIDLGAKLILTCDTGITANEAADYARSRGVDMVITDHHDLPESLPQAFAVVDPKLLPSGHPLATLSGAGVAYKLAEALFEINGITNDDHHITSNDFLDLTALGLVADLAILRGEARSIVQRGLDALRNTRRLGLKTMMELAELSPINLTEEHIGFVLGPRLNALGRLGDANPAVDLLTTSDPVRARVLAVQLEGLNTQRQLLCSQVTRAAEAQLRADPSLLARSVLVLGHPAWPGGIVGIVASRLVERYRKPAILFSMPPGEPARGSARSVEGVNITAAIAAQKDLLLGFGGHPMAAGLSLDPANLPEFYRRLAKNVAGQIGDGKTESVLEIDAWLGLPEVSLDLATVLEQLAPFGPGNEKLTLATRGLHLDSATAIGRNKEHLKLAVSDEAGNAQTVLWWDGAGESLPESASCFDLAYTIRASDWRGTRQVQMEFVDYRLIDQKPVEVKNGIEIVDQRNAGKPLELLKSLPPATLVWAEAEEKAAVGGVDRNDLHPAETLAIWTIPPSPEELRQALEIIQPKQVVLFAVHPALEVTENFMARLTGLIKYAINNRNGKVTYAELAAATAQRVLTVQRGLGWLIARGSVHLAHEENGLLQISPGNTGTIPAGDHRLWIEIQTLLAETAAYRAHFRRAGKDTLLP
jgi:single-stranded-DNA-specific exonuclease